MTEEQAVRRKAARYRVHLAVRYETAAEFRVNYAENLSRGGLFVHGASGMTRHRDVQVSLDLPGFGTFQILATVAHVISAETAQELGREPGIGFKITDVPEGFEEALRAYLARLEQRAEAMLWCSDGETARQLLAAGFQVTSPPPVNHNQTHMGDIGADVSPSAEGTLTSTPQPPLAWIGASEREADKYRGLLIWPLPTQQNLNDLLAVLDTRLEETLAKTA